MTTRAATGTELAVVLCELGEHRAGLELAERSLQSGLAIEHDPARGNEWNHAMAVAFANSAECHVAAGRASELATSERRAHLDRARSDLDRANELMRVAEAAGELGADERVLLDDLAKISQRAEEALAAIPEH